MQNYALYAHGGSCNHGCEAITRSLVKILSLNHKDVLLSKNPSEDVKYGMDKYIQIRPSCNNLSDGLLYRIKAKLSKNPDKVYYKSIYRDLSFKLKEIDIALSIGGDNYCYKGVADEMSVILETIRRQKISPILLGCSIEMDNFQNYIHSDFIHYKQIIARESKTYFLLKDAGLKNIKLIPDPAFQLDRVDLPLPEGFVEGNTVGINVSPMIIGYEKNPGMTLQNYKALIQYLIDHTDMQIALIPHVVWRHNDDRIPLQILYDHFKETGRVCMIRDHNAEELKGYIARCRFMIAARTHASIAAYSQEVPTLVVGYSVKARGIARDLFGTDQNYVIPVQSLQGEQDLVNSFIYLMRHEQAIKTHLVSMVPEYKEKVWELINILNNVC